MAGSVEGKKIFCVIDKHVGFECLKFLINNFARDSYTIVIGGNSPSETYDLLLLNSIKYIKIQDFNPENFQNTHFDWLLNLWGNIIFKKEFLNCFEHTLNIHPSYLPYCRGSDPIVWTIQNQCICGVTLHCISQDVDCGDIWYQQELKLGPIIKGKDLYSTLIELSITTFKEQWGNIRNLVISPVRQPNLDNGIIHKRRMLLADRLIDAEDTMKVKDFILKVNSHDFYPKYTAICTLNNKKYGITLNLEEINE